MSGHAFHASIRTWLVCGALLGGLACATPPPAAPPQMPPAAGPLEYSFSYTPEPETEKLSATLGMVSPQVAIRTTAVDNTFDASAVQALYAKSLLSDFNAVLIAKGYGVTGPYDSIDDMTFGEKQRASLVLVPTVTLDVAFTDGGAAPFSTIRSATGQHHGNFQVHRATQYSRIPTRVTVNGFIELVLYEPLSEQKMWVKKIEVPFQSVDSVYYRADSRDFYFATVGEAVTGRGRVVGSAQEIPPQYDQRPHAVAQVLQGAYEPQLSQFSRYFDPQEITHVMTEAEEARSRARF